MANSSIPLQYKVQVPDVAAIEGAAQQARANDQQSQLTNFKIQQAPAEMAYAAKERELGVKKMGAEGAALDAEAAAGHPDIRKKLFDIYQGMKPDEYERTIVKQRDMRHGYNYVMSFPPGDARKQAFDKTLEELHKKGVIDDATAREAHRSGPTDLMLTSIHDQLTMLEQITTGAPKPTTPLQQSQIDLNKANAGKADRWVPGGRNGQQDPLMVTNRINTAVLNVRRELGMDTPTYNPDPVQRAKDQATFEARKQEIYKAFGADQNGLVRGAPGAATVGTGVPGSTEVDPGVAGAPSMAGDGSEEVPFEPQSPEDMQGLNDGDYYINPSDNQLYVYDSTAGDLG